MNRLIQLFIEDQCPGSKSESTWFEFDPLSKLGWSFEETLGRILSFFNDDERERILQADLEKSCFIVYGLIDRFPFSLSDWKDDRCLHVYNPNLYLGKPAKPPKGVTKAEFVHALKMALRTQTPVEFKTCHVYDGELISWPPTKTKDETVKMAYNALYSFLQIDDWHNEDIAPKAIVEQARTAMAALQRTFNL